MKHLIYSYYTASYSGINKHAQEVMKELGITYTHSTPQSMADSFWFWNCGNIPDKLPEYIGELEVDPMKCVGLGLSKEKAKEIIEYSTPLIDRE